MPTSITSANSQLVLTIPGVFSSSIPIQGYAADGGFTTEAIHSAETMMGMDGRMSAGFVFAETKFKITLNADSPSKSIFDDWRAFDQGQREISYAQAVLTLPSTKESYTMTNGVLTSYPGTPAGKKVLQPVEYELTFESITRSTF